MENLAAPNAEQAQSGTWEHSGERDGKRERTYRRLTQPVKLYKRDLIEDAQFHAAMKFEKHYYGMFGADVREGVEYSDPECEMPTIYHGQKLSKLKEHLGFDFHVIVSMVIHDMSPDDVAAHYAKVTGEPVSSRRQTKAAMGVDLIQRSLQKTADFWGLTQKHAQSRDRPA